MAENVIMDIASRFLHKPPYHYVPTRGVAITFVTLFSLSTLIHVIQAAHYRMWWLLPTAGLCGILEILGWSARLWSSFNPDLPTPFEMQITATILGPTPLLAANFVILGIVIQMLGVRYSRLSPRQYMMIFCSFDVISLIVQGVGGGKAAVAAGNNRNPTPGGHIMLGGIAFQLFTITVYASCAAEFFWRYSRDKPFPQVSSNAPTTAESGSPGSQESLPKRTGPMKLQLLIMSLALLFSTTCLFIRAVYRTIELSDGWAGRIISTQRFFNYLDGGMIILAICTLNIVHPGLLLGTGLSFAHASGVPIPGTGRSSSSSEDKEAGSKASSS